MKIYSSKWLSAFGTLGLVSIVGVACGKQQPSPQSERAPLQIGTRFRSADISALDPLVSNWIRSAGIRPISIRELPQRSYKLSGILFENKVVLGAEHYSVKVEGKVKQQYGAWLPAKVEQEARPIGLSMVTTGSNGSFGYGALFPTGLETRSEEILQSRKRAVSFSMTDSCQTKKISASFKVERDKLDDFKYEPFKIVKPEFERKLESSGETVYTSLYDWQTAEEQKLNKKNNSDEKHIVFFALERDSVRVHVAYLNYFDDIWKPGCDGTFWDNRNRPATEVLDILTLEYR